MLRLTQLCAAYTVLQAVSAFALPDRVLYGEWDGKGGDALTTAMNLLSIAASIFLVTAGALRSGVPSAKLYLPFAPVAILLLSVAWSFSPSDTLRRSVNYVVLVVGAMGMARSLTTLQIMQITVASCAGAAVASLALYPTAMGYLINTETGAFDFRGIFSYKNMLGEAMVAGVLAALYCFQAEPRRRLRYAALVALFVLLILLCKSGTSLLISVMYVTLLTVMTCYAKGGVARTASLGMMAAAGAALVVVAIAPDLLFELMGKDATLTGRTELWPYVIDQILAAPLTGWGFNAFWLPSNPAAMGISDAVAWYVPEAHNGLLELLLELGLFGTALFVAIMVREFMQALHCMKSGDVGLGRITVLFLVGLLLMSVSEAILLTPNQVPTLQFFLYAFLCETDLAASSTRRRRPAYRAGPARRQQKRPAFSGRPVSTKQY